MFQRLPAEIALHIASYLPLQSLYQVSLVSTEWHSLIANNQRTVYRNAAILHRFVPDDDLGADGRDRDWIQFCRRRLGIERGWRAKGPSQVKELTATGKFVHRIKVDQKQGFVITTCHTEGLYVTDISTDRVLWAVTHVTDYPHCEYDRGYVIFNRRDDGKEVWRLASDFQDSDIPEDFEPDDSMINASEEAALRYPSSTGRGHFRPWALLHMPDFTRAFRFSYPTLLSAGLNNAYLWDVPTSRLVETISNIQAPNRDGPLGRLNYVDVNDKYVFICGLVQLRIFAREGGALVYYLTKTMLPRTHWDVLLEGNNGNNVVCPSSLFQPQQLRETTHFSGSSDANFQAAHVSPGNDLVALTSSGIFIWVPNFERLIHHAVDISKIAVVLNFSPAFDNIRDISVYLALGESNEKAAVATRAGLFVLSLDPAISRLTAEAPPHPGVSVCRVMKFDNKRHLSSISCLQMTNTGIFFNWCPSSEQNRTSQPARHIAMALPPPPQFPQQPPAPAPAPAPAPSAPTPSAVGGVAAPAHNLQEEGQNDHLPVLVPIESSDEDDPEEDASSHTLSPAPANPAGPSMLVDMPEENEEAGGFLVDDDDGEDFDMDDLDEPEMVDEIQFNVQFNGDGFMQVMHEWFHPVNLSTVHCIHV